MVRRKRKTHRHAHAWKVKYDPGDLYIVFFLRGKAHFVTENFSGKSCYSQYSKLSRRSSSALLMQEYCREQGVPPTVKVGISLISLKVDTLIYLKHCGL